MFASKRKSESKTSGRQQGIDTVGHRAVVNSHGLTSISIAIELSHGRLIIMLAMVKLSMRECAPDVFCYAAVHSNPMPLLIGLKCTNMSAS